MAGVGRDLLRGVDGDTMSAADARVLTDRLVGRMAETTELLVEAYTRRAWKALGYASWQQYVSMELGLSTANVRRHLNRHRFIEAFAAIGASVPAELSVSNVPALNRLPELLTSDDPTGDLRDLITPPPKLSGCDEALGPIADRVVIAAQRAGYDVPSRWVREVVAHALVIAGVR